MRLWWWLLVLSGRLGFWQGRLRVMALRLSLVPGVATLLVAVAVLLLLLLLDLLMLDLAWVLLVPAGKGGRRRESGGG